MKINLKDHLLEQLRIRFAPQSVLPYHDNKVLFSNLVSPEKIGLTQSTCYEILSPNIIAFSRTLASLYPSALKEGAPPGSFDLDITQKILEEKNLIVTKNDLKKIKSKKYKLALIGYGGAMFNMLWYLFQYARRNSYYGIFKKITIIENDTIDLTNIFRFEKLVATKPILYQKTTKGCLPKIYLNDDEKFLSSESEIISFEFYADEKIISTLKAKGYILVGAPDLTTRKLIKELEANFFFLGHQDLDVSVEFQPDVSSELVNQTYGLIDIPALFVNLQVATAAFIKALAYEDFSAFEFNLKEFL